VLQPIATRWAVTYEVSPIDNRRGCICRPLQVAGARKLVSIHMDGDAAALNALMRQLAEIRAQRLPALRRN
jgi:hypothetical protein